MARAIFVVHGALGSAEQLRPAAAALAGLGDVYNIELPGHGATPLAGGQFTIDAFVTQLATEVRRRAELNPRAGQPIVFGYSMGGYVALALEARAPGTFAGIVTLGTKFDWSPEYAVREGARLDANLIAEKVPKFAAVLAERHAHGDGWLPLLAHTAGLMQALGAAPVLTRDVLSTVRAEVIVMAGSRDDTLDPNESRAASEAMPRATFMLLDGVPHPIERVPLEHIAQACDTVLRSRH